MVFDTAGGGGGSGAAAAVVILSLLLLKQAWNEMTLELQGFSFAAIVSQLNGISQCVCVRFLLLIHAYLPK